MFASCYFVALWILLCCFGFVGLSVMFLFCGFGVIPEM